MKLKERHFARTGELLARPFRDIVFGQPYHVRQLLVQPLRPNSFTVKGIWGLFASILLLTQLAFAQSPDDMQQLKSAEQMTYSGHCDEAVALLRDLRQRSPYNLQINAALKNALVCNKELDSALAVLDGILSYVKDPALRYNYVLDVASIYLKKGDTKTADQKLQSALSLDPNNPQAYEQAANMYMSNGFYPDAVKIILDGRKKFNNPNLFTRNLGQLYEVMRNYGDAAREYFQLLQNDSTTEVYVTGKIEQLIKIGADENYDTGLKTALAELVKQNPRSPGAHRYFGDYLMSQGRLDEAFQRFRLVDSLDRGNGKNVFYFAQSAKTNGDFAAVEKACNYLLTTYPNSILKSQTEFLLAESYYDDRRFQNAKAIYERIADQSVVDRDVWDAFFDLATTDFYGLHDAAAALEVCNRLVTRYPQGERSSQAQLLMADCSLAQGNTQLADSLYKMVPSAKLPQRSQEELLFKQAELQFYLGNFEDARVAYGKVMNTFPKSVYVNDCLRRIMLISDHPGMEEATLKIFADAVFNVVRFQYDSALAHLDKLKHFEGSSLSDISWYNSGEIYRELQNGAAAISQYDSLVTALPESFYAPLALERKGDVYADLSKECQQAKSTYESVLLKYHASLNAEDVRRKLQRVERVLCAQPDKSKSVP